MVWLYGLGDVRGGGVEAVLVRGPVHHVGLTVRADIGVAATHHHHLRVVNHLVQAMFDTEGTLLRHHYKMCFKEVLKHLDMLSSPEIRMLVDK